MRIDSVRRRKRGVAGIVAAVLLFAMLFTTGTAYFLFVSAQNQVYSQSLINRENAAQNKMNEVFTVTPTTSSTNTLGFTLQNTGNIPITVASLLLMDSAHDVLGLYNATSATQTAPALPYSVNTGTTSTFIDTGYSYIKGDNYLMEVITQRGSTQTVAYPPDLPNYVKQAQASGSLTVDMSTFKWIQVTTGALVQNNYDYQADGICSGSACSLQYQNTVTGGNLLAVGIGWYGQSAPTLTDSFRDSFTLDTSNSISGSASPTIAQSNYNYGSGYGGPCGSSSCSLNFRNNVNLGNIILVGIGWFSSSTSSISSVTDTRGTSFTALYGTAPSEQSSGYFYSDIYYGTTTGSGSDSVTVSFSGSISSSSGAISIYEVSGASTNAIKSSSGTGGSGYNPSVASFTPQSGSLIVGNVESGHSGGSGGNYFGSGSGYNMISNNCNPYNNPPYGCSEYGTAGGGATTVMFSDYYSYPWVEVAIALKGGTQTYYSAIWSAEAGNTGYDTVTATFPGAPSGVAMSIYELSGYLMSGQTTSAGQSTGGSTTASVSSFTPPENSFVLGNVEVGSSSPGFTAGSPYTLDTGGRYYGATCNDRTTVYGCSEEATGISSATTVSMTFGQSVPWTEVAVAFQAENNQQTGALVNGYPAVAVPGSCQQYYYQCPNAPNIVFQITFTNEDPKGRSVALWPQSSMSIDTMIYSGGADDNYVTSFYIVDGLNNPTVPTGVIAYNSTHDYIVLPVNTAVVVYFGADTPLSSNMQQVSNADLAPFEALFTLTGLYSDNTLFGQTIPFPSGIVTGSLVTLSATSGGTNTLVSVTTPDCTYQGGCFLNNRAGYVGWIDSSGVITVLKTFTTDSNGNVNTSFTVPSASAGYYTVIISDYVNSIFYTFQHT